MYIDFGVAVVPTRVRAPRDKAKVEQGVQDIQRRILAPLRNRRFFSLEELNEALWELLEIFNDRRMQLLDATRRSLFEELDQPKLRPLPRQRYTYAEWKTPLVGSNYHVQVDDHSAMYVAVLRSLHLQRTQS